MQISPVALNGKVVPHWSTILSSACGEARPTVSQISSIGLSA
jgi:hypothetical protein